jgi:hypothetical protein
MMNEGPPISSPPPAPAAAREPFGASPFPPIVNSSEMG